MATPPVPHGNGHDAFPSGEGFFVARAQDGPPTAGRFAQGCTAPSLEVAVHAPPAMHRCAKARLPQPGRWAFCAKMPEGRLPPAGCWANGSGATVGGGVMHTGWGDTWRRIQRVMPDSNMEQPCGSDRGRSRTAADPPREARLQHGAAVYQRKRYATSQRRIQRGIPSVWRQNGHAAARRRIHPVMPGSNMEQPCISGRSTRPHSGGSSTESPQYPITPAWRRNGHAAARWRIHPVMPGSNMEQPCISGRSTRPHSSGSSAESLQCGGGKGTQPRGNRCTTAPAVTIISSAVR